MEIGQIKKNAKGFTLVELAIVLVVIGLLMGMAFKGKSLIDSARLKADIQKINKISTAVNVYYSKYDTLPGKYPTGTNKGKIDSKTFYETLIGEGLIKESDSKMVSLGNAYLHVVGCENVMDASGLSMWKTVDASEQSSLCIYKADVEPSKVTGPANNTGGARSSGMTKYEACQIETLLDDKNLNAGDGRIVEGGSKKLVLDKGFDCAQYPQTPGGGASNPDIGAYAYRIF